MKFNLAAVLAITIVISSPKYIHAQAKVSLNDKLIDKILDSNVLIKQGITELTFQRCNRFLSIPGQIISKFHVFGKGTVSLNPILACNKASTEVIKVLDFYQEKVKEPTGQTYYIRLVFKKTLIKMIQERQTTLVLKNIIKHLKSEYFNLYDSVFEIVPNKEKTLELLAVLLQDFTLDKLHFLYLELELDRSTIPKTVVVQENMELLDYILSDFAEIKSGKLLFDEDGFVRNITVDFYPTDSLLNAEKFRSLAYHYWVPAYVAYKLSRSYQNSDAHSYLAAFSFNYFYEVLFRTDLKLNDWSTIKQLLSLEDMIIPNLSQAYDIYLAHEGPYFALNHKSINWPPQKFVQQIMTRPSPAYRAAVQQLR